MRLRIAGVGSLAGLVRRKDNGKARTPLSGDALALMTYRCGLSRSQEERWNEPIYSFPHAADVSPAVRDATLTLWDVLILVRRNLGALAPLRLPVVPENEKILRKLTMYAVIKTGGKQYRVAADDKLAIFSTASTSCRR